MRQERPVSTYATSFPQSLRKKSTFSGVRLKLSAITSPPGALCGSTPPWHPYALSPSPNKDQLDSSLKESVIHDNGVLADVESS